MRARRVWTNWVGICVSALLPGIAAAQPVDDSAIDTLVRSGQHVLVTNLDGHRVKGRVTTIDASTMTLLVEEGFDDRAVTLATSTIATVRKSDSLLNGFLIGLGSGLVAGEVWIYSMCGPPGYDAECRGIATPIGWAVFGGSGVAIGTLIDKFSTKLLYRAPDDARHPRAALHDVPKLRVQPLLTPGAQGVRVSVAF